MQLWLLGLTIGGAVLAAAGLVWLTHHHDHDNGGT